MPDGLNSTLRVLTPTATRQQQQQQEAAHNEIVRHRPAPGRRRDTFWSHAHDQEMPTGALPEEAPAGVISPPSYDTAAIVLQGSPSAQPNRPETDGEATCKPLGIAAQIGEEPVSEDEQNTLACISCCQRGVRCEWGLPENSKLLPCLRCKQEGEECSFSGLSVVEELDSEDIAQVARSPTYTSPVYTTVDEPEPSHTLTETAVHCRVDGCSTISRSSQADEYASVSNMD
jgi:hypothetical protein